MLCRERTYFMTDTLEYLHKGGRIGGAQALLGGVLQVKPILTIKDGRVESAEAQRTTRRALTRLKEIVFNECSRAEEAHLCVQRGGIPNKPIEIADEFKQNLGIRDILIYEIPPTVLVHSGPRAIGVNFFTKNT